MFDGGGACGVCFKLCCGCVGLGVGLGESDGVVVDGEVSNG